MLEFIDARTRFVQPAERKEQLRVREGPSGVRILLSLRYV